MLIVGTDLMKLIGFQLISTQGRRALNTKIFSNQVNSIPWEN